MLATVNPSKWSLLVKSYYHTSNNQPILYIYIYDEASHVNCSFLTNKRTILSYPTRSFWSLFWKLSSGLRCVLKVDNNFVCISLSLCHSQFGKVHEALC